MRRKKLSELFGKVDPEPKVTNGGKFPHQHNKRTTRVDEKPAIEACRNEPYTSTDENWEKTGAATCPISVSSHMAF